MIVSNCNQINPIRVDRITNPYMLEVYIITHYYMSTDKCIVF